MGNIDRYLVVKSIMLLFSLLYKSRLLQELSVGAKFIYENKAYELVDKTLVTSPRFYPRYTCINVKTGKKKTIASNQSVQPIVEGED